MRKGIFWAAGVMVAAAFPSAAFAQNGPDGARPTPEQRTQMMKKIHRGLVLELGELLDLDTAGTVKLAERLQKFDDQRIQLRLDNADAMDQLRSAAHNGTPLSGGAALAHRVAQNRVQLAQIDQAEMDEVLKIVPADKIAKVAVFVTEYPRRIERMAREIHQEQWTRHNGPPRDDE